MPTPAARRPYRKFQHTAWIELWACPIVISPSLTYLDSEKLGKGARAEIEVGFFESKSCRRPVRAIVEKGMVTRLQVEPCSDATEDKPVSPELRKLLKAAAREARSRRRPTKHELPLPVGEFVANAEAIVRQIDCFCICFFGYCIICCVDTTDWSSISCSPW